MGYEWRSPRRNPRALTGVDVADRRVALTGATAASVMSSSGRRIGREVGLERVTLRGSLGAHWNQERPLNFPLTPTGIERIILLRPDRSLRSGAGRVSTFPASVVRVSGAVRVPVRVWSESISRVNPFIFSKVTQKSCFLYRPIDR